MLHRWFISHFQLLQFDINLHVKIISSYWIFKIVPATHSSSSPFALREIRSSFQILSYHRGPRANRRKIVENRISGEEEEGRREGTTEKGKAHEGGVARVQIMQRMTRHRPAPPPTFGTKPVRVVPIPPPPPFFLSPRLIFHLSPAAVPRRIQLLHSYAS